MSKTIEQLVLENPSFQKVMEMAPDEDREKIQNHVLRLTSVFQTVADQLSEIANDPDKREKFRSEMEKGSDVS